jgi:hypothetical protein
LPRVKQNNAGRRTTHEKGSFLGGFAIVGTTCAYGINEGSKIQERQQQQAAAPHSRYEKCVAAWHEAGDPDLKSSGGLILNWCSPTITADATPEKKSTSSCGGERAGAMLAARDLLADGGVTATEREQLNRAIDNYQWECDPMSRVRR